MVKQARGRRGFPSSPWQGFIKSRLGKGIRKEKHLYSVREQISTRKRKSSTQKKKRIKRKKETQRAIQKEKVRQRKGTM